MAFAVIETGGKQYRVSPGSILEVEKIEAKEGSTISFDKVLMYQNSKDPILGTPFVEGITVTAEVLAQTRGQKIRVFTYKPKKRQRRTQGHRQQITQLKIMDIETGSAAQSQVLIGQPKEDEAV